MNVAAVVETGKHRGRTLDCFLTLLVETGSRDSGIPGAAGETDRGHVVDVAIF